MNAPHPLHAHALAEFRELAQRGNLIPVYTELIADAEIAGLGVSKDRRRRLLVPFRIGGEERPGGRYSFVGAMPRVIFESRGRTIRITENGAKREFETDAIRCTSCETLMHRYRLRPLAGSADARFAGGAVGYLGYDIVRFFEPTVPAAPKDELDLPESFFFITDTLLIFDHRTRRLRIVANALRRADDADRAYDDACAADRRDRREARPADATAAICDPRRATEAVTPRSATPRATNTMQMVRDGQEYIRAGDIFQFVPSQRFETDYTAATRSRSIARCVS